MVRVLGFFRNLFNLRFVQVALNGGIRGIACLSLKHTVCEGRCFDDQRLSLDFLAVLALDARTGRRAVIKHMAPKQSVQ